MDGKVEHREGSLEQSVHVCRVELTAGQEKVTLMAAGREEKEKEK